MLHFDYSYNANLQHFLKKLYHSKFIILRIIFIFFFQSLVIAMHYVSNMKDESFKCMRNLELERFPNLFYICLEMKDPIDNSKV